MQIKIFTLPIGSSADAERELNHFLSSHRVLDVVQHFVSNEHGEYWSFCIRYLQSGNAPTSNYQGNNKLRVDYKEVLSESEFEIFSKLRVCRKQIAADDAVPAYAVFTDEELAGIAKLPKLETSQLISIKGIGDKKVAKYGQKLMEMFHQPAEK